MLSPEPDSLLLIPPKLAGVSFVYLGVKIWTSRSRSHVTSGKLPAAPTVHGNESFKSSRPSLTGQTTSLRGKILQLDGVSIVSFRVLRLLAIVMLFALQTFDITSKHGHSTNYPQLGLLVSEIEAEIHVVADECVCCRPTLLSFLPKLSLLMNHGGGT